MADSSDSKITAGPVNFCIAGATGADLDHAAVGREVAKENRQGHPCAAVGVGERADDVGVEHFGVGDVLAQRFAGDRDAGGVEQAGLAGDGFEDGALIPGRARSTSSMWYFCQRGRTLQISRDLLGDLVDAVELDRAAGLDGDGQGVQDRVGRAAHGHVKGEGVFEGGRG